MAELSVDTSSYPKNQPSKSVLETASQFGALQNQFGAFQRQQQDIARNDIGIAKDRLDLINQHYDYMIRELNSLGPNPTADEMTKTVQKSVDQGLVTPEMYGNFVKSMPTDPRMIPQFRAEISRKLAGTKEQINQVYGVPGLLPTNQGTIPTRTVQTPSPNQPQGVYQTNSMIPSGLPPGTQTLTQRRNPVTGEIENVPQLLGNHGQDGPPIAPYGAGTPGGGQPQQPSLPVQRPTLPVQQPIQPKPAPTTSYTKPVNKNEGRLPVQQPMQPNQPNGPITGLPPGVGEAEIHAGTASGQQLARDREVSSNYQKDIFPLTQAIPLLEKLGPKGTGVGTETINHLKSFVLSNVPGVRASDFNDTVADYDKANKYLKNYVNQTGSTGTNDKLAASFAGNPSVNISNAAAVDVAKSALALRRMQQALLLEFENSGAPASQYSRWQARNVNTLDPRAFGHDMMSPEAKKKLQAELTASPSNAAKFERSLEMAKRLGIM